MMVRKMVKKRVVELVEMMAGLLVKKWVVERGDGSVEM